jgi:hypothetical protein
MRFLKRPLGLVLALAMGAVSTYAQWPDYPTPGPRAKDGKIDLSAPPPKTADGKPDFPDYGNRREVRAAVAADR